MSADNNQHMVSTEWLAENIDSPDVKLLDASWYLPAAGRDARAEYSTAHIPGARFFDIDDVSDNLSDLPHMLPPVEKFVSRVRRLGIGDGHKVVVYDGAGLFSAARVWWMFRVYGHMDVVVLDGGLPKWKAEGRPVDDVVGAVRERHFTPRKNQDFVRDVSQVARATKLGDEQIVDARASERYAGEAPEPRKGLRSGHIPGSKNLPFSKLLNADGTMKKPAELAAAFEAAGIDLSKPVITSCGSGVTAAVLSLALAQIGHKDNALYDGSWAEWGLYDYLAVETGAA